MKKREPLTKDEHLERITTRTLHHALRMRPIVPVGLDDALEIAMDHPIDNLKEWFKHEVTAIISHKKNDTGSDRWGDLEAEKIVLAALRQVSATDFDGKLFWIKVLADKRYSTVALQAFSTNPTDLAEHLGMWWDIEPADRQTDLHYFVSLLVSMVPDPDQRRHLFGHLGARWSEDLRMAVRAELTKLRVDPIFPLRKERGSGMTSDPTVV